MTALRDDEPGWRFDDEPDRHFDIRDASGRLHAVLIRTADKQFIWRSVDGKPGLGGRSVEDLPLYRTECLGRVPLDVPVVLTEGAKDCDACLRAGLAAVGTVTGAAGTPSAASLVVLLNRVVVLWPDFDDVGRQHMERIAEALVGIARRIHVVDVVGLLPKGGAADVSAAEVARRVGRALRSHSHARP